ncbi:MAG: LysR family transcriptional regulator [Sphingomonadales bacterium]
MDWDKLRVFYSAAETRSFTRAGERLNLSQSAISRQIAALEHSLKTTLFHRHARGIVLTEQGELLRNTVSDVFKKIEHVESQLMDSGDMPRGDLRIAAPIGLGSTCLPPMIREFLDIYPDIRLQLILSDCELDLTQREADVAIRLYPAPQGNLIQRRLMTVHHQLYGSRDYLSLRGAPNRPEDLDEHDFVVYGPEVPTWFRHVNWGRDFGAGRQKREPVLWVNNIVGVLRAVESGVGIATLPHYLTEGSSQLVRLLPKLEAPRLDAYFVYPEALRKSKRVAVLRDFLVRKLAVSPAGAIECVPARR